MANKEINIFSTSFLDLLSGALAAVLILFIIVPKLTKEQDNSLKELEELKEEVGDLKDLMEQIRNSVPAEIFEEIQAKLDELQETVNHLTTEVEQLRQQLAQEKRRNEELEQKLNEAEKGLKELEAKLKEQQKKKNGLPSSFMDKGDVEVFILWAENVDVDLYVQNMDNDEVCSHPGITAQGTSPNIKPWGCMGEDINSDRMGEEGSKYYEYFYQYKPVPGRYKLYMNIFDHPQVRPEARWNGKSATINGYVVMHPGKENEIRIDFPEVVLRQAMQNHVIGTLIVTENNITIQ